MNIYSIYDMVAREFSSPFLAKNDGVAMRMFGNTCRSERIVNPNELELYCIGKFLGENLDGCIEPCKPMIIRVSESDV
ncbi:nonstructural protein [Capybara microvirus Cap1_SP_108]|nr:nonstructural protein [Capybara microvirus Cap1_SP_108]